MGAFGGPLYNASIGPGNANAALYVPCRFPVAATITAISWRPTNTTGNYDFGLYDKLFNRIASKGSTAMANAQVDLAIANYRVPAGGTVWAAFALSNTSGRYAGYSLGTTAALVPVGCQEQASALALPDPATPAAISSWLHIPIFTFTLA
jgi:hypothetical protein